MRRRVLLMLCVCIALLGTALSLAQRAETVLTVALPGEVIDRLGGDPFADFEAANPGVRVIPIPLNLGQVPFISTGMLNTEGSLTAFAEYANRADVLYLPSDGFSPITTETGYLLDLDPLLTTQADGLVDAFFPNLWASARWSGGTWAVPVGASLQLLLYDVDAFDALGLAYPSGAWTVTDLTTTLDAFAVADDDAVALDVFNTALMLRVLAGVQLYDPNALRPQLTAEVADALDLWTALEAEDTVDRVGLVRDAPLRLDEFNQTSINAINADAATRVALLPGNIAGMHVHSFGMSSGTANPELAFELLVYLSALPDLPQALRVDVSARTDLPDGNGGAGPYIRGDFPTDDATLLTDLLPNALPPAELHFEPYFNVALDQLAFNGGTGADAGATIEDQIAADMATAAARRDEQLFVIAPTPTPVPDPETVRLRFGLPIIAEDNNSNFDRWVDAARDFAAEDAVVDQVDFITDGIWGWQQADNYDCFYLPFSEMAFPYEQVVLNLDPLFEADPTFDEADVLPTVLDTVRVNGELWSVPLHVDPQLLYYDFMALGEALDRRWTVNDMDAVFAAADPADGPLFTYQFDFRLLEPLVAAYGGTLFDYSTEPPTARFTEAETISALNRVIGLIDEGLIATSEMTPGPSSPIAILPSSPLQSTRYQPDGYDWLLPPRSDTVTPVSYIVGSGYISATTTQPEACFRWLRAISENPTLLPGLPAITAAQNTPEYTAVRSPREVSILSAFNRALRDDNVQRLPFISNFSGSRSTEHGTAYGRFSQAIMTVIEEDRDLETALEVAAEQIEGYYACAAPIPAVTSNDPEDLEAFGRAHLTCLVQVDPEVLQSLGVESIDELYEE